MLSVIIPRIGSLIGKRMTSKVIFLRTVRAFREKLVAHGYMEDSDALYDILKPFKEMRPVRERSREREVEELK